MKVIPISMTCLLALAGCQTVPDRLPQAEPGPAAACAFPVHQAADSLAAVTRAVDVLEEWGFSLDATDTRLGLVSASRERELVGYYDRYDYYSPYGSGFRLFGGMGVGRGSSIGLGVGGRFGAGVGQTPTEVERVSVLVSDAQLRLSRDIRRFDHFGEQREAYSASNDDFCGRFQTAFQQARGQGGL